MGDILIIKLGATGDVIRTTPLLRAFPDRFFWISSPYNLPVVPLHVDRKFSVEQLPSWIFTHSFDCIINLEESLEMAELTQRLNAGKKIGVCLDNAGRLVYSSSSKSWFDMSLISVLGRERANQLKWTNRRTYQSFLFEMVGKSFAGEEYVLPEFLPSGVRNTLTVGLEERVGKQWPNKAWNGYTELKERLEADGITVKTFEDRPSILDYIREIASCRLLVTGDTLAMHLGLGLRIPCVTLFNCTAPWEIEGYHRMAKHVSPLLEKYFYKTDSNIEARSAIPVSEVYESVKMLLPAG